MYERTVPWKKGPEWMAQTMPILNKRLKTLPNNSIKEEYAAI